MLNKRQQLTLEHLWFIQKMTDPGDVVRFCLQKLALPRHGNETKKRKGLGLPNPRRSETRKHKKSHYEGIIRHLLEENNG